MIFYVSSMDQYGASAGDTTFADGGTSGWNLDNDIMLGDGWANLPTYVGSDDSNGDNRPQGTLTIEAPSWGARQGDYALVANAMAIECVKTGPFTFGPKSRPETASTRLTIPGATAAVRRIHIAFSISELPISAGHGYICDFLDDTGAVRASLRVTASGRLEIVDGDTLAASSSAITSQPTSLIQSNSPVISPETWYSLNIQITTNGSDADADVLVYVGDIDAANLVINASAIAFTDTSGDPTTKNNIDILGVLPASMAAQAEGSDENIRAVRDIVLSDSSGSYNTSLLGQVFCSAQEMRTEEAGGGWVAQPRSNIDDGILNAVVNSTGIRLADAAALEIGSSDFTFETFARFSDIPTGTGEIQELLSKWATSSNLSYRLYYSADDDGLVFEWSTDGSASAGTKIAPFTFDEDRWYHIAVVRWTDTSGSYLSIFVDGVEVGGPTANTDTLYDGTASLGIGANFGTGSTPDSDSAFVGYLDETRFTIGVGRYTANFSAPTTKFGRDVGGDSDFASVVLLMGYDSGTIEDESSAGRTLTINASPVTADQPDDDDFSYQVLNQRPAWDDSYIEGAYTYATGIFTFTAQPSNGDTMTIGSQTYTWVTSFSTAPADEILIGADVDETIDNTTAAINGGAGEGTTYGTGTTANSSAGAYLITYPQFGLQALTIGTAGNSVATTETSSTGAFNASTLEGGQDLPDDSDFNIERLPIDVSGVLAVQTTARAYKTEAGSADVRFDLVGPSAGVDAGSAQSVDLNPSWFRQIHEEDPDTTASLTPSTIIGGKIRFKRTS